MKSNTFARNVVKVRVIILGLAIVSLVTSEVGLAGSVVQRSGHLSSVSVKTCEAPSMSIGEILAAAPGMR